MKALINSFRIALIFIVVFSLSSCEKKNSDTGIGSAEFTISPSDAKGFSVSGDSALISYHIMISVEDMEGNPVLTDTLIPLYIFGSGFMSENIELKAGQYNLTKFLVINPSGEVVYAAPVEGSPLAYLVKDPLPVLFKIFPERVTRVSPEVLYVGGHTPDEFGYASFGMQIIKPLHFWTACILVNPEGVTPGQYTTAKLTIYAPDGWHYTFKLEATVNHLIIRGGYPIYTFLLEKEGYLPQKMQFTAQELLATTPENPLILQIPGSELKVLVLQPGPEDGKDAMISNLEPDKNFGDHKYFEATFLPEPILTVMRSNRSLIWFNLNQLPKSATIRKVVLCLFYDIPIPFDSTYLTNADPSSGIAWYGGVLQQIVEPWEEYKVTWNTQPKTIEANQVYIPPFIRNVNFIDVNVTRLFVHPTTTDNVEYPNYGMLFRLWPTERFPGFRFASSDYPLSSVNIKMWPMLTIYYTLP